MNRLTRLSPFALLALAALLSTAGCKSNQNAVDTSQAGVPDSSADPASANLAPVSTDTSAQPAASSAASTDQAAAPAAPSAPAAPPPDNSASYNQAPDDSSYGEQPVATAPEPPPALPDYQQPPDPGDGYLWTPGYWNYAAVGYYWVPGVWVQAPYQGALWTPGYWGWTRGHYGFFRGYWGPHIGFYGGVNYGFGYGGVGYQGGYWNSGHFFYNRAVNNINVTVVHNVYNYRVNVVNNTRVSFNGGSGGIQVRARPAELAAFREPHAAPMGAQVQIERTASTNRAQFASENHGRPASVVIERPLQADRDVRPVAPPAVRYQPAPQQRGVMETHPNVAPPARAYEPSRNVEARPAPRPEPAPYVAPHPAPRVEAPRPQPQERPAPHTAPPPRPAPREPAKPEQPRREEPHSH